jgi:mono/diheme cytochrome c family protein
VCEDFSIGRVLTILLLIASLLTGCDAGDRGEPGTGGKSEVGPIPSYPQRPGDPEKGHDALRNRAVTTCGLPYGAYVKARGVAVRDPGPQLSGRAGRNAELPYGLTAYTAPSGVELVTTNCLICHAATIEGQLILGLGNAFLDLTRDPLLVLESMGPLVAGRLQTAEWRRWSDRIAILADYLRTDTAGVNSADNLTLALMAHRDPETLAWSDRPLIEPPPGRPLPLGVPPWWNMRKKHAMFYNGAGRGDQARLLMHASTICTDSVPEALAMDDWLVDVRAYLATLAPPRYPHPIDRPLAERGYSLFRARCRTCHGTYGDDWRYPNKLIALGKVGTDPALARAGFWDRDRFVDWFQRSFYGELAAVSPGLGYVAPPLDGIWATAPYLHNDSVPTLAALLESPARPRYWELARSDAGLPLYDQEGVGWRYLRLSEGKSGARSWEARHRVYDTTQKGYGNGGHAFGDALDPQERRALIEYLKTL